MGVLGWTEEQTLDTTLQGIVAALRGRNRLITNVLKAVFGEGDGTPTPAKQVESSRPMSPELFDAMFG